MTDKKKVVISLGGSLIIPEKINLEFLKRFREVIKKNSKNYKFIIVCGGGKTARNYIHGLENENLVKKVFFQCLLGISATRMNARFMTYFFGRDANKGMPHDMTDVKNLLRLYDIVFCGALRYSKNETSDTTSAKLANFLDTEFINMSDVSGLYNKNPKKFKDAVFIPEISYIRFYKISKKFGFKPGQHFILDKKAAKIIKKNKIPTYLIGTDIKNFDNLLNKKDFIGTVIKD